MDWSRRKLLGVLAMSAIAGCSGTSPSGDDDTDDGTTETNGGLPNSTPEAGSGTSRAGSCASNFGDTLQQYDPGNRGMIASFGYPMGGEITFEQSDSVGHVTSFGYGRGEISPRHTLTVSERGPFNDTGDATEAYAFNDAYESESVTTYGGQQRLAATLRRDESVVYNVRVDGPDGFYEFAVQTSAGEGDPCLDTYESVTRRVIESFEPVA